MHINTGIFLYPQQVEMMTALTVFANKRFPDRTSLHGGGPSDNYLFDVWGPEVTNSFKSIIIRPLHQKCVLKFP